MMVELAICLERDLNPHDRNDRKILSLVCIPVPPSRHRSNIL